mgnify:CR=1 FL=1
MNSQIIHTTSCKVDSFEKLIELCDSEKEATILEFINKELKELDYRYVISVGLSEFFQYCINLIENGEFEELKSILTRKVNRSASEPDNKANVINMHSLKKAI